MICLCCGKTIQSENSISGWHKSCIKRFFGTNEMPEVKINQEILEALASESTHKGYTVPGVQKKLSLHLWSGEGKPRLTLINYPTGYILKPQVPEYAALPEAEQLVMCMADVAGISTVPHALVKSGESVSYITKRIDRVIEKDNTFKMLAMEDFCQLDLRMTQDKYKGSYERCTKIIKQHSSQSGLDMTEFFMRVVFSYLVGNSDMHLKNFSLVEKQAGSGEYVLSPAYDLLPVNVILPEDQEQMALALNGKKMNLRRKDFLIFAENCGIAKESAEKMMARLAAMIPRWTAMCKESLLPDDLKENLIVLMAERAENVALRKPE